MKPTDTDDAVELYFADDFKEDRISEREFVVIQTHLSSLMQDLLRQTGIDKEK